MTAFISKQASPIPDIVAPDGSTVRVLCGTGRGSMATFTLSAGATARAVQHRTVEEIWYIVRGRGQIWRKRGADAAVSDLSPGLSLIILPGDYFQFRNNGDEELEIVAVTMPPWPGAEEAVIVEGKWRPTV